MAYELKGGEEWQDGHLYGWTGAKCERCRGTGQTYTQGDDFDRACAGCGGTGDAWGLMPHQPAAVVA